MARQRLAKYRGSRQHRKPHPKIFVWSHTERAEIEYFQSFKNHLETELLMPMKKKKWKPQELLENIIDWKKENIFEEDGDQVWCIFDVDDFYKTEKDKQKFLKLIGIARKNNIKIAYINECFELWILLHFENPTAPIRRGKDLEKKIQKAFKDNKLGEFEKNKEVFQTLLPFQPQAIKNSKKLLRTSYEKINWKKVLSAEGNPSTSIHLLVEEINKLIGVGSK